MKKILLTLFLLSMVLLRPGQIQQFGLIYAGIGGDDFCYLSHATAIAFGEWPNYSKETICRGEFPMASIGPGLVAVPAVFLFSQIDRLRGATVLSERTAENVIHAASTWGFIFTTLFIFGVALQLFRHWLMNCGLKRKSADWVTIFFLLLQGVPLFAYRRPIFSHSYELLACVGTLWFFSTSRAQLPLKVVKEGAWSWKWIMGGAFFLFLLGTSRPNNLPLCLLWPLIFYSFDRRQNADYPSIKNRNFFRLAVAFTLLYFSFKVVPTLLGGGDKYASLLSDFSPVRYPIRFWGERLLSIFFGMDWGLIFTAPFLLVALFYAFAGKYSDRRFHLCLIATLAVNFYLAILFGTNGGWYGHRYFLIVALSVSAVPFGFFFERCIERYGNRALAGFFALALMPAASMLLFEGNDAQLTLHRIQIGEHVDYGNLTYQLEVWRMISREPVAVAMIVFKGVPAYAVYVIANIVGVIQYVPALLRDRFEQADYTLLIQVFIAVFTTPAAYLLSQRWFCSAGAAASEDHA